MQMHINTSTFGPSLAHKWPTVSEVQNFYINARKYFKVETTVFALHFCSRHYGSMYACWYSEKARQYCWTAACCENTTVYTYALSQALDMDLWAHHTHSGCELTISTLQSISAECVRTLRDARHGFVSSSHSAVEGSHLKKYNVASLQRCSEIKLWITA